MKLDVKLKNNTLDQYDKALSTYKEWKSFYRDIKLSTLLEGKKIQFDIDNIQKIGTLSGSSGKLVSEMCFIVSEMCFIIKDNNIEKLTLEVEFLGTDCGKKIEEIYKHNLEEIEITQIFTERNINFIINTKNPFN